MTRYVHSPVAGVDYEQQSVNLEFSRGSVTKCHNVTILHDDDCELPMEKFFADLSYISGIQTINIIFPTTEVNIHESNEPECGKLHFVGLLNERIIASTDTLCGVT